MPRSFNVLFLAAEADPFVKVGGLGDVAGSLPLALRQVRVNPPLDARLVIPFHPALNVEGLDLAREMVFSVRRRDREIPAQVFRTHVRGLPVYLIAGEPIDSAASVYSSDSLADGHKYTFFSLAVLELARRLNWRPDILHANDWHTAMAVSAIRDDQRSGWFFSETRTVLSIHNLGFMGAGASAALYDYGLLPVTDASLPDWARHIPLPMGLWAADALVAVSPTYAREILTPEYGCGLEHFLSARAASITGILNGIDEQTWDPSADGAQTASYDAASLDLRLENKQSLQTRLGFAVDSRIPLLAMVTRMDPQKGVDVAVEAMRLCSDLPWQLVILGTGIPYLEDAARRLEADLPERVSAIIRYDSKLSRQIYGGADMLLMPSRYEPCGLAQMIAMRYGCLPLVRATGGLRDTVREGETGFVFEEGTPEAMAACARRALHAYQDQTAWQGMQTTAMKQDFSWARSAYGYWNLYQRLTARQAEE